MSLVKILIGLIAAHVYSASFFAGFVSEEALLFISFLSGQGDIPFGIIVFFGFLGIVMHDLLFYFIPRTQWVRQFIARLERSRHHSHIIHVIETIGRGSYFLPLLLSKVVYGTRIPLLVYASTREKSPARFLFLNGLAVACWCAILLPLGWLAGQGFSKLFSIVKGIEMLLGIIVLFALFIYMINRAIRHYILKE